MATRGGAGAGGAGGDAAKLKEAQTAMAEGDKAVSTSMLKWKPDYLAAEPAYQRAARAFKSAGLLDSAVKAWRKAADCSIKLSNVKQAVATLDAAARELSYVSAGGAFANKEVAAGMLSEAGSLLFEVGEAPRAAELKLRAGKMLEGFNNDRAAGLYDEAAAFFDGDEDKDVYAKEALSKVFQHHMALGKHASAMKTLDKLAGIYVRLNQPHNLSKLILSRVVLLLAAADPVSARREFDRQMDAPGFLASAEAGAAEDLLAAYSTMEPDAVKAIVDKNVFNYLDNSVTRLARSLPATLTGGAAVGAAHAGEVATKGLSSAPAAGRGSSAAAAALSGLPAGFRVVETGGGYGSGAGTAGISSAGGFGGPTSMDAATLMAARDAERDSFARAALFSRPDAAGASAGSRPAAGGAGDDDGWVKAPGSSSGSGSASNAAASRPAPSADAAGHEHDAGYAGAEHDDFDFAGAIAEVGADAEDDDGHSGSGAPAGGAGSAAGSAPAPAAVPEDDLGLL